PRPAAPTERTHARPGRGNGGPPAGSPSGPTRTGDTTGMRPIVDSTRPLGAPERPSPRSPPYPRPCGPPDRRIRPNRGPVGGRADQSCGRAELRRPAVGGCSGATNDQFGDPRHGAGAGAPADSGDRKSTRLNSSHVKISYAVLC